MCLVASQLLAPGHMSLWAPQQHFSCWYQHPYTHQHIHVHVYTHTLDPSTHCPQTCSPSRSSLVPCTLRCLPFLFSSASKHPIKSFMQSPSPLPHNGPTVPSRDHSVYRWSQDRVSCWLTIAGVIPSPWGWCLPGMPQGDQGRDSCPQLGDWGFHTWIWAALLLHAWENHLLIIYPNHAAAQVLTHCLQDR